MNLLFASHNALHIVLLSLNMSCSLSTLHVEILPLPEFSILVKSKMLSFSVKVANIKISPDLTSLSKQIVDYQIICVQNNCLCPLMIYLSQQTHPWVNTYRLSNMFFSFHCVRFLLMCCWEFLWCDLLHVLIMQVLISHVSSLLSPFLAFLI